MAGIGSSTSQRMEESDTSSLTADERVAAARARHRRQQAIMNANAEAGFTLGEDRPANMQGRLAQEAKWQGANVDARVHFSVRELLYVQRPAVLNALDDFHRVRTLVDALGHQLVASAQDGGAASAEDCGAANGEGQLSRLTPDLLQLIVSSAMPGQGALVPALCSPVLHKLPASVLGTFRIFVRVRPLLPAEMARAEYSALDVERSRQLVCHDARLARSGRRLTMIHHWYWADKVFGATADEESVCDDVLEPLLERVINGDGDGTALLYGQTGAGKTHTMTSLLERVAARLGGDDGDEGGDEGGEGASRRSVEVQFFEVAAKGCMDLLNERAKILLRSDEDDVVHA